ncbi:MAG TPA: hypothetical protein VFE33_04475 [Thermoanaerobaculia bacterium]|nr:hypothetical protein [Thermoanaerobaculia bacterium]
MRAPCLLLLSILIALPSLAGTAYIPFVAEDLPGADAGRSTTVDVEIYNQGTVGRRYAVSFVRAGEDGSQGGTFLRTDAQAPGTARTLTCCDGGSGMLIVSGAPQIAFTVHLNEVFNQPSPNMVSLRLPLVTAADALPAGSHASLQRLVWEFGDSVTSSVGIVNLGHHPAHCTGSGISFPAQFPDLQSIDVPPVSVAAVPHALHGPVVQGGTPITFFEQRPTFTCDQPFYPFALVYWGLLGASLPVGLPWVEFVPPTIPLGNVP